MGPEREPPLGQMLGPVEAPAAELLDFAEAVAQGLLVDMQIGGGQLP